LGFEGASAISIRLVGLAARAGVVRLARPFHSLAHRLGALRGRRLERLAIAPSDIRTADPIAARDIYAGYFALAGRTVNAHGHSPFEVAPPTRAWGEALHGFAWLRDLDAAGTALSRANARALIEDWLKATARRRAIDASIVWDARVVSRRLLSWLSHSPMILENADQSFYRRFARALQTQTKALEQAVTCKGAGEARLNAAIALTQAGLAFEDAPALLRRATKALSNELAEQILGDGGHVGRNPQVLVDLLLDLLPTRQAFAARGLAPPDPLLNAIDRMTPVLRLFRHRDGALANFNGMGVSEPEALATLLAYAGDGVAIMDAPYSGYQRLEAGSAVAIVDVGAPPPWEFSKDAHAGCLSFEFSAGGRRLIVNCGAPPPELADAHDAARATAAHSTLIVDDHSSCHFARAEGLERVVRGAVLKGPSHVAAVRTADELGLQVQASHDGYLRAYGVTHQRSLLLSRDGAGLWGEDRLTPSGKTRVSADTPVALRFHLHPDVSPQRDADSSGVTLVTLSGERWRFASEDRAVVLEETIFFAAPGRPRRSTQIVVHGTIADCARLAWSLVKI
jgi:uncharacterized heparinase superfamily protein